MKKEITSIRASARSLNTIEVIPAWAALVPMKKRRDERLNIDQDGKFESSILQGGRLLTTARNLLLSGGP
jgi:hypothetical protein